MSGITDVFVIYNNDDQINRIKGETFKVSPFFTFIDERKYKSRKEAYKIKNHWAAFATPFAICMNNDKPIKAFYSETGTDIIAELINYLHEIR